MLRGVTIYLGTQGSYHTGQMQLLIDAPWACLYETFPVQLTT